MPIARNRAIMYALFQHRVSYSYTLAAESLNPVCKETLENGHGLHDPANRSPEYSFAELLRVTLLLMKPYAARVGSQAQLRGLEKVMQYTIEALESVNTDEKSGQLCRRVLQF